MKSFRNFLLIAVLFASQLTAFGTERPTTIVTPTAKQAEWADCEIGVLIHFDMPVFRPDYVWNHFGTHPDASVFNPTALNTDQWLATAKKLGAKYAVLVAKHCSGFSLWPTAAHEYSVKHSPWKNGQGDIVADFIHSCHKYGIRPGIYASTGANGYLYVDGHHIAKGAPVTAEAYRKVVETQLTELWSHYGKLFEIWFDGGVLDPAKGGANIEQIAKRLQPDAIAFQGPYGHPNLIRWVGNEQGTAPYPCWATADSTTNSDGTVEVGGLNGNPNAPFWCPGESDFTLRYNSTFQGGWFWHAGDDDKLFSVDKLMQKYETSVGHNTNMLLGMVVDSRGLVPDADAARIAAFGEQIQLKYGTPLKKTSGQGTLLEMRFSKPVDVDRVVMQEDIRKGERVLAYSIEGLSAGQWLPLASGSNIGHKHIDLFKAVTLQAIRLRVTQAKAEPHIKNFAVYQTFAK